MAPHQSGLNNNSPNAASLRQIVSALVSAIPPPPPPIGVQQQQSANPLREAAAPETRNVFLTLYALFEKELLPALDLLDRGLVTRLKAPKASLLLVRSAQQQHHARSNPAYEHVNYYEVRLDAWSCSCPAFTFSAFPAAGRQTSDAPTASESHGAANEKFEPFGGLSRGTDLPICKHLLACALVEHCQLFAHFVDEREVSIEEIAGWAAGWGD